MIVRIDVLCDAYEREVDGHIVLSWAVVSENASERKLRVLSFSTVVSMLVGGPTAAVGWGLLIFGIPLLSFFLARLLSNEALVAREWFFGLGPLFSCVGAVMAGLSFRRGLKLLKLLRRGILTRAKLVEKTATNVEINERTVYKLKFRFEVGGRRYAAMARTHEPELLEDDAQESVLYLPDDPSQASLVDHLPGKLEVKERTVDCSERRAFLQLVLPVIVLLELVVFVVRAVAG